MKRSAATFVLISSNRKRHAEGIWGLPYHGSMLTPIRAPYDPQNRYH